MVSPRAREILVVLATAGLVVACADRDAVSTDAEIIDAVAFEVPDGIDASDPARLIRRIQATGEWVVADELLVFAADGHDEAVTNLAHEHDLAIVGHVAAIRMWQLRFANEANEEATLAAMLAAAAASPRIELAVANGVYSGSVALYPDDGYTWSGVSDDTDARQVWLHDRDIRNQIWGQWAIGLPEAWGITSGTSGRSIQVVDSEVAPGLPDFAGRATIVYGGAARASMETSDIAHGTHVTGIVGATGNNRIGIAGVNWTSPLRLFEAAGLTDPPPVSFELAGYSLTTTSALQAALVRALEDGDRPLINLSQGRTFTRRAFLGGARPSCPDGVRDTVWFDGERNVTVTAATWRDWLSNERRTWRNVLELAEARGALIVAAAGNNADNADPGCRTGAEWSGGVQALAGEYPDNVILVAAVGGAGVSLSKPDGFFGDWELRWFHLAPYSSTGPLIDVAAPGTSILSLCPTSVCDSGTAYLSGTSMAAPFVTGVASLVWGLRPDWTAAAVKRHLVTVANTHGHAVYASDGGDERVSQLAFHVLHAGATLRYLDSAPGCTDTDRDGYGAREASGGAGLGCRFAGVDCDDGAAAAHPGATELCNHRDDNCDGRSDENGVCADEVVSAPISGIIPGVFDTDGGEFRLSVSPLDPNGDLITAGIGPEDFTFNAITVERLDGPGIVVATGSAEPTGIEILQPTSNAANVSVVMLLDSSGSMADSDPAFARVQAARDLIRQLAPEDEVAIFDFGSGVGSGFSAAELLAGFGSDDAALERALGEITAQGSTPMYEALLDSLGYLATAAIHRPVLLLLSDGMADSYEREGEVIQLGNDTGIAIYVVGLGAAIDFQGLEHLAAATGGSFSIVGDPSGLGAVFEAIGVAAGSGRIVVHGEGRFTPPLPTTGRHLVAGVLRTSAGAGFVDTPFSFSVDVR